MPPPGNRRGRLALLALAGLLAVVGSSRPARGALDATATITAEQLSPSEYQYDITLNDIGTTNIETFWFAWVPGSGFLASDPSNILNPSGWNGSVFDTYSIQWTTTTAPLVSGDSLTGFQFNSTDTPTEIFGQSVAFPAYAVGTSFVYAGTPFSTPSLQFVATPEPSTLILGILGALGVLLAARCRRRGSKSVLSP